MNKIKISVIMPIFNMEKYLEEALISVITQTLDENEMEIICVNDCSTDNTIKILNNYKKKHKNFIIINNKTQQGAGNSRNIAMKIAQGEFLAFLDADDYYYESDILKKLYYNAKKNNMKICGGSIIYLEAEKNINQKKSLLNGERFLNEGRIYYKEYQKLPSFVQFIFSTDFIRNKNIIFPSYTWYEDPPFFIKAMVKAKEFYVVKDYVYVCRITDKIVHFEDKKYLNDMARGMGEVLSISGKNELKDLHINLIETINAYVLRFYKSMINDNKEIKYIMYELANEINENMVGTKYTKLKKMLLGQDDTIEQRLKEKRKDQENFLQRINKFKDVIIYGAGRTGKAICYFLEKEHYNGNVEFAISEINPKGTACGKLIYCIDDDHLIKNSEQKLVIVATGKISQNDMINNAKQLGFSNIVVMDNNEIQLYLI